MDAYYADANVTLYHGDCLNADIAPLWNAADVLVTDPPYGIAWRAEGLHSTRALRKAATPSIANDQDAAVRDAVLALWPATRPAVIFGTWRVPRPPRVSHRLIWHKQGRHPGIAPAAWYPTDEEVYLIGNGWLGRPVGTVITTTEQRAMEPGRVGHPTLKPIPLMEQLISKCPSGVIADPFAGSGSTLVAARNLGRHAVGVEIDEAYCELIAKRLSQGVLDFGGEGA